MPIVRIFVTPTASAPATSSASGAGPRSRWVCESITGSSGLREEGRELLDLGAPALGAVHRVIEGGVLRAEGGEQLLRGRGDVGREQDGHDAQALRERAQRRVELAGLGLVLGELPGRALLDVAVEAPHPLPD